MRFVSIQYSKMQLRSGSALKMLQGSYSEASPDPPAGFKGSLCGVKGRDRKEGERDRKGGEVVGC